MKVEIKDRVSLEEAILSASPVDCASFGNDGYYKICDGEELFSYYEKDLDVFFGVCRYQTELGYELYNCHSMNGNFFATYYKNSELIHIYWIECECELNVAYSSTGGKALPFAKILPNEKYTPSVTQLKSDKANGMGYVVQLSDGSFIIYDGGYRHHAEQLWNTLVEMNGSEENIVIQAWLITHSHGDHYPCFIGFAENYADKVKLETFMMSPVNADEAQDKYLNGRVFGDVEKFDGAKILYLHTGMLFDYGNVNLEILFTADELYIVESPTVHGILKRQIDLNETSIVSRVYTEKNKCLFLGDAYSMEACRMIAYYGNYLRSDMCQASHHGLEEFPLIAYRYIKASILFYPCSETTYTREGKDNPRFENVRRALRESKYTKEIITHDKANETRPLL